MTLDKLFNTSRNEIKKTLYCMTSSRFYLSHGEDIQKMADFEVKFSITIKKLCFRHPAFVLQDIT